MNYKGQFPKFEYSEIKRLDPGWSDHTCFAETIKGRKSLHPRLIRKWFDKLVDKNEYGEEDKYTVLQYLIKLAHGQL
jgi:hypothetical protein